MGTETKMSAVTLVEDRPIFTMKYKLGHLYHDLNFFAVDQEAALNKANTYIQFLAGSSNIKVMLIGQVRPLAIDIDKEISRQKNAPPQMTVVPA
jgi:hypothetical protein